MQALTRRSFHHSAVRQARAVFDEPLKLLHYSFAANKPDAAEYAYLREEMAAQLVDRLADIKRSFPTALDLGARSSSVLHALLKEAQGEEDGAFPSGIRNLVQIDAGAAIARRTAEETDRMREAHPAAFANVEAESVCCELAEVDKVVAENSVDLVFSNLALHWTNDLAQTFAAINRVLKPDG